MDYIALFESSVPGNRIDSSVLKFETEESLFIQFPVANVLITIDVQLGASVGISQSEADGAMERATEVDVVTTQGICKRTYGFQYII